MTPIRKEVSEVLGYTIPEDGWQESFKSLQKEGRVTNKHILEIIVLLLEREEKREESSI